MSSGRWIATIGYEGATQDTLVAALRDAAIDLLVDVRAVANSRRPGFSKRSLTAALEEADIEYLHLRGLGTPAAGRAAARAGRHEEMHGIFAQHMQTLEAQDDLFLLAELVGAGRKACLLCLEASHEHCHRTLVAAALDARLGVQVRHLEPALPSPTGS
jgi:uncharacterized protein (DUF488 family)